MSQGKFKNIQQFVFSSPRATQLHQAEKHRIGIVCMHLGPFCNYYSGL